MANLYFIWTMPAARLLQQEFIKSIPHDLIQSRDQKEAQNRPHILELCVHFV